MTDLIKDCDDLIAGMEKCGDAWWGDIGEASDEDWRKLREIAYRIRARASLQPEAGAKALQLLRDIDADLTCRLSGTQWERLWDITGIKPLPQKCSE